MCLSIVFIKYLVLFLNFFATNGRMATIFLSIYRSAVIYVSPIGIDSGGLVSRLGSVLFREGAFEVILE